jgi:Ala-tRNA(Pro) deacylase
MTELDTHQKLIDLLESSKIRYRLIHHKAEGNTRAASKLRGHSLREAAKCLVLRVGLTRRSRRYVLSVVPGDREVDFSQVRSLFSGRDIGFARSDIAEGLTGSVSGAIAPFSFNEELDLVVDEELLNCDEIYFNAGRLDRSVALASTDYIRMLKPRTEQITRR